MQCQGSEDSAQHSSFQAPASADILLPSQANGMVLLGEAEVEVDGMGSRRSLPYHGTQLEHSMEPGPCGGLPCCPWALMGCRAA